MHALGRHLRADAQVDDIRFVAFRVNTSIFQLEQTRRTVLQLRFFVFELQDDDVLNFGHALLRCCPPSLSTPC